MPEPLTLQQRFVPGAPPPAPLSKAQKKKRKAKVKTDSPDANDIDHPESPIITTPDVPAMPLIENAPDNNDSQKDVLAPGAETPDLPDELKHSPVVELVSKRLKATTKKIVECIIVFKSRATLFNIIRQGLQSMLPRIQKS